MNSTEQIYDDLFGSEDVWILMCLLTVCILKLRMHS